ncbi:hypothetical protein NL676_006679 [Syzygium grande]|nr:hypothetical protein NL676_006679 [Syzygium grande]
MGQAGRVRVGLSLSGLIVLVDGCRRAVAPGARGAAGAGPPPPPPRSLLNREKETKRKERRERVKRAEQRRGSMNLSRGWSQEEGGGGENGGSNARWKARAATRARHSRRR